MSRFLLLDQDRSRWDQLLIRRGLAALERAEALSETRGSYTIQAAIAACHARAVTPEETSWTDIAAQYVALMQVAPSPVVALNHAVAMGMAFGPEAALEIVEALRADGALADYHLLFAVRADLLIKLGRTEEARKDLERAAELTKNERERQLVERRLRSLAVTPRG